MSEARSGDVRQQLQQTIEHLEHILPGQAPIRDFVHHNTLHGYQQLHFREAVARSRRATGAVGYMSREAFRKAFQRGRVLAEDLEAALASEPALGVEEPLFDLGSGALKRREVYVAALLHPLHGVSACQLSWQQEELEALSRFQPDVPEGARQRLLESQGGNEAGAIAELWEACLELLGLEHYLRHPEELVELTPELNERLLRELAEASEEERHFTSLLGRESASKLRVLLDRVGEEWTLRDLLRALTGVDLMDEMRPYLARHLASWLDLGMSSWHHRDRSLGFYPAWMRSVQHNLAWVMEGLEEWRHHLDSLPEDPFDAIIEELRRLSLPRDR
ncbi:MAG TPA: DUF2309 family protein, partial [Chromatiaceae bacterium]|nr:DUF2309 family protein [Chromatiaceae bacterium]